MGKSRSATAVCAYLMRHHGITADQALSQIRESRPLCEPNEGFWKQLELYHQLTRANGAEADAGRHLLGWARAAGFTNPKFTSSTWTFADEPSREWWGGLWADRIVESSFATQSIDYGLSTADELAELSDAFRRWAAEPDATFIVVHGELLARA